MYIPLLPQIETTARNGYANIDYWDGGNFIYAHNYLSGGEFYNIETVTALYLDGSTQEMSVKDTQVYAGNGWEEFIISHSSQETLTLITCYPKYGMTSWRFVAELENVNNDRYNHRTDNDPRYSWR